MGLLLTPGHAFLWRTLTELSSGISFVPAIAFINLRTNTQQEAASLSVLLNTGGYSIAALGPFFFGVLHDMTHSWNFILLGLAEIGVIQSVLGWLAGRNKTIDD